MFIKITKSKNNQYAQIAESYREGENVKHRVLFNLGCVNAIKDNPSFQRLVEKLVELTGLKKETEIAKPSNKKTLDINNCSEAEIKNWGYKVYKKIWTEFEITEFLNKIKQTGKTKFDFAESSFIMAAKHLLSPSSKLGTYKSQDRYIQFECNELNHLYRSLDLLAENKEALEKHIYNKNISLFNMKIDIVFYDVTTIYFESFEKDELRNNGFSKDNKFKEVQVVVGLLIDKEGRPVGYELFSGDTFDGKTLKTMLENLKKRFEIEKIIIVADRGINSKINLKSIKEFGYGYIVAARIKNMGKSIEKELFDDKGYIPVEIKTDSEPSNTFKYKIIDYTNKVIEEIENKKTTHELKEKIIFTYSDKRASKDRKDRERLLEKAENLLREPGLIDASNKRCGKKYIKKSEDSEVKWELDEKTLERDKKFDGYYAIQTSELSMSSTEILNSYHTLWKIEESFRIMKTTLETRPVFHWTVKRIKGHFVICFLAFLMERTLEYKLKNKNYGLTPEQIRAAINSMEFAQVTINGENILIKTKLSNDAKVILKTTGIKSPDNITALKDFKI